MRTAISALILDFDGVVADTEPLHYEAFQRLLAPEGLGFTWEEYVADYIGFDDRDAFALAYRRHDRTLSAADAEDRISRKAEAFQRLVAETELTCYPGVRDLLRECRSRGVPIGLCSGALRRDIDAVLERVGLPSTFDAMVTADDVERGKPDPEGYRQTLDALRRAVPDHSWSPGRAVAVEDTPGGIEAARGAGLVVVGVATTQSAHALRTAHRVVPSLADLTWADLELWVRRSIDGL